MDKIEINTSPSIPRLARPADKTKVNVRYTLISPYSSAHIYWDKPSSEMMYDVEEPILDGKEKEILKKVENGMKEIINLNVIVEKNQDSLIEYINKNARMIIDEIGLNVPEKTYKKIFYFLFRDFLGLNDIESLMRDYFIEDIECNGINTPIYVVHRLYRSLKTNISFNSVEELANFVEKLAQRANRYISYASPILDGTLPDGSRVNATYTTDISSKGPTFTIRKFTKIPWTPTQLISLNTLSPEMMAYFWMLIEYKSNILITGGTASGKTTMLNAISFFIPPESRVVSIEDTRELNLLRENWLPSVARTAIGLGKFGEIDLFSLLKNSFRQNPDYVIVGEVRGQEASVLFQGMASGHASISTIHADSVDTVIKRLETPPIELSPTLLNILDAVAVMSHAIAKKQETRKLREIVEIVNITSTGDAKTNTPFLWDPKEDKFYFKKGSVVFDKISIKYGISKEKLIYDFERRTKLLFEMYKRKIFDAYLVQKIINDYYKNPEGVLESMGIK